MHASKCCDSDECESDIVSLLLPTAYLILSTISWRSCHQASSTASAPWGLRTYKGLLNLNWKIFTHYQVCEFKYTHTHTHTHHVSWFRLIYLRIHTFKCCDSDECEPDSVSLLLPTATFTLTAISWRSCNQASSTVSAPWGLHKYKNLLNPKWKIFTHYFRYVFQCTHTHTHTHTHTYHVSWFK